LDVEVQCRFGISGFDFLVIGLGAGFFEEWDFKGFLVLKVWIRDLVFLQILDFDFDLSIRIWMLFFRRIVGCRSDFQDFWMLGFSDVWIFVGLSDVWIRFGFSWTLVSVFRGSGCWFFRAWIFWFFRIWVYLVC